MIIKILGILDLIGALLFWLFTFFGIGKGVMMVIVLYLIIKGLVFVISADIASILDIIAGVLIYVALNFTVPRFISILVVLYLVQKGIVSLV